MMISVIFIDAISNVSRKIQNFLYRRVKTHSDGTFLPYKITNFYSDGIVFSFHLQFILSIKCVYILYCVKHVCNSHSQLILIYYYVYYYSYSYQKHIHIDANKLCEINRNEIKSKWMELIKWDFLFSVCVCLFIRYTLYQNKSSP